MTLTRLLFASLVVCSALAFAQTKTDSLKGSDQAAAANNLATVASSEPWKIIPNQPTHATSGSNALDLLQVDKYNDLPAVIPLWAEDDRGSVGVGKPLSCVA